MAHRTIPPPDPLADQGAEPFRADLDRGALHLFGGPVGARLGSLPRPNRSWLAVVAGLVAAVAVGWWLLRPGAAPIESALPLAAKAGGSAAAAGGATDGVSAPVGAPSSSSTSTVAAELVVQAAGQVNRPGVYRLPIDARVDDLVREAGGLTGRADGDRVNLAAPLVDGERIWVPAAGEDEPPDVVAGAGGGSAPRAGSPSSPAPSSSAGGAVSPSSPVDLNTATADELDALPGVGPATAAAILAYRDEHGRFSAVDDLLDVRGIGDAKLEQIRPLVRV